MPERYGYMLERDAINGKDGVAFIQRDGQNIHIFNCKNLDTTARFRINDFVVVGTRLIQKKVSGVELTGSMTLYYGTPVFLQMLKEYLNDYKSLPYFDMNVVNDDTTSTVGKQTIVFRNCKIHSVPISKLDATTEQLTMDVEFSFTNIEILDAFHEPISLG